MSGIPVRWKIIMKEINYRFHDKNWNKGNIRLEIDESHYEYLQRFVAISEMLTQHSFIKNFKKQEIILHMIGHNLVSCDVAPLDWKNVEHFIYKSIPIYKNNEPTNFYTTVRFLMKIINHPSVSEFLTPILDAYNGSYVRQFFPQTMDLNDHPEYQKYIKDAHIVSKEVLDNYLNSEGLHFNSAYRKKAYTIYKEYVPENLIKYIIAFMLQDRAISCTMVSIVINNVLEKKGSVLISWSGEL